MMISFHEENDTWRRYRRAFMIIPQAHKVSQDHLELLTLAIRSQQLLDDADQVLTLPKESRVIYVSKHLPKDLTDALVIKLSFDSESLKPLWNRDLRALLSAKGLEPNIIDGRLNDENTDSFISCVLVYTA